MPNSSPLSLLDTSDLDRGLAQRLVSEVLRQADDGELFVERRQTESLVYDDGKLKAASFDESQGFGLRAVRGETAAYAHATEISEAALKRAAEVCRTVAKGDGAVVDASPERSNRKLYADTNPAEALGFSEKVALLQKVDAFARGLDPRVVQVSVSLGADWRAIDLEPGISGAVRPLQHWARAQPVLAKSGRSRPPWFPQSRPGSPAR